MGSREGVAKIAAKRCGLSLKEYESRVSAGKKFCWRCSDWHDRTAFVADKSRGDGLSSSCAESRNSHSRGRHQPRPRISRRGRFFAETRDGDKKQARRRINHHVETGLIPNPNSLPCADCGHLWTQGERRHEYDHHLGYSKEHQMSVQAVCTSCHHRRERERIDAESPA